MSKKYTYNDRVKAFWSKVVVKDLFECWEWTGSRTAQKGYGQMKWDGRRQVASRIVWQMSRGVIPKCMLVLHKCDNRLCVNPAHLFLGTYQDNADDMKSKGRSPNNAGELNPYSKLKLDQVAEIRRRYARGERQSELGKEYGVTKEAVWLIVHNKNWR